MSNTSLKWQIIGCILSSMYQFSLQTGTIDYKQAFNHAEHGIDIQNASPTVQVGSAPVSASETAAKALMAETMTLLTTCSHETEQAQPVHWK